MLRLTLLAPEVVEAIMDGRQAEGMTLPALMKKFPVEWAKQYRLQRPAPRAADSGRDDFNRS